MKVAQTSVCDLILSDRHGLKSLVNTTQLPKIAAEQTARIARIA